MLESLHNNRLEYQKLSESEQKARKILGRLVGVIADFKNPTRNGRKYSEQLWENVFNNPIMQEKIKNRCCFGELCHPEDRTETDIEKIAICLAEQPKKSDDGKVYGVFDILDTPNGRILKTLCDYGCNIGISSRGQGDLITDANGDEAVDPDTYDCECWDVVLVPGVESARLKYVNESLDKNLLKMKKALNESLQKASEEDKKVMESTLKNLHINLNESADDEEIDFETYKKVGLEFVDEINSSFDAEKAKETFEDYEFDKHLPEDEVEQAIYDALKAKMDECLTEAKEKDEEVAEEKVEDEQPEEEISMEDVEMIPTAEENPVEADVEIEASEKIEAEPVEEPVEEPVAEAEEEEVKEESKTDEEIFFDYLKANFDEEQIKKACKALEIEAPEVEAEEEQEEEAEEESVEESAEEKECDSENCADKSEESKEGDDEPEEAEDNGDEALVETLKETLKTKDALEESVRELQEKLAVSDTKVNELIEENNNHKKAIARLAEISKTNKDLRENVSTLEESLKAKDAVIEDQKTRIARLAKSNKENVRESLSLNESINSQTSQLNTLTESLNKANDEVKALKEQLETTDNTTKELNENLKKTTSLKEAYKNLANKAVNKYIEVKARTLGLTSADIKRKLGESYSLDDVDQVCEDLKAYQLNISKLPFEVGRKMGVKVNEGKINTFVNKHTVENEDDDVDETLIKLANLN